MGEASLLGELHATNHWGSLAAEAFEDAPPFTAMGKLEQAFFAERKAAAAHRVTEHRAGLHAGVGA
jgi:hypothetical protein